MTNFDMILNKFSSYDYNKDGIFEINSLKPLDPTWHQQVDDSDNILLIIINPTLLKCSKDPWVKNLRKGLDVFRNDLINDNYFPVFIMADVYSGQEHQDGLTVLAIRRFFQEVKKYYPNLKGAIFIGSFPEAQLVRTYPRKKHAGFAVDDSAVIINGHTIEDKDYLRIWPEIIATRSDLVLCDLDGNWEQIYHKKTTKLPKLTAIPQKNISSKGWPEHGSLSILDEQDYANYNPQLAMYEKTTVKFQDFFHINDGKFNVYKGKIEFDFPEKGTHRAVYLKIFGKRNLELTTIDLKNQNPIAIPEIIVSRIDAKHVAVVPKKKMLNMYGLPQEVGLGGTTQNNYLYDTDNQHTLFERDPVLECRLIVEYLERNHRHRTRSREKDLKWDGIAGPGFVPGDIWRNVKLPTIYVDIPGGASLSEYVAWLRCPTLVRFIIVHSNQRYLSFRDISLSALAKKYLEKGDKLTVDVLERLIKFLEKDPSWDTSLEEKEEIEELNGFLGSKPERWFWDDKNLKLCPGWKNHSGRANIYIHKALWNSGMKHAWGRFYFVDGCNVLTPDQYNLSYDNINYGREQVAESLLFYCGGLTIIARAKTFNDVPSTAGMIVLQHRRFGEIWSEYFNSVKQNGSLYNSDKGISRKKPYFWGIIGDWTLRISYNK